MSDKKRIVIIVSEKSLDKAMMPMMLATTGAALGAEVHVFFTFWGLDLLKKKINPKLKGIMAPFTSIINAMMRKKNIPGFHELRKQAMELGVKFYACSTTMELMGVKKEDLVDGCEVVGASTFLNLALESDTALFIG